MRHGRQQYAGSVLGHTRTTLRTLRCRSIEAGVRRAGGSSDFDVNATTTVF